MRCALAFFAYYAASLLPKEASTDFLLAIGGHGTVFYKPGIPLANDRIWVAVDGGYGWTNSTFTKATEVRVDSRGNYELEAIVGDARRRTAIKGIRLYIQAQSQASSSINVLMGVLDALRCMVHFLCTVVPLTSLM